MTTFASVAAVLVLAGLAASCKKDDAKPPASTPAAKPEPAPPAADPAAAPPAADPAVAPAAADPPGADPAAAPAAAIPASTCPSGTAAEDGLMRGCKDDKGLKQGMWRLYTADAVKEEEGLFLDDQKDGNWQRFWPDGKVDSEQEYKAGKRHGRYISYRNGPGGVEFRSTGCYQDDRQAWMSTTEADKKKKCP